MPKLVDLVTGVYRDLADESKEVFSTVQVEDFIRGGIADLNRAAPMDTVEEIELVTDPDTGAVTQWAYNIAIELPYRVEVRRKSDGWIRSITDPDDSNTGIGGFTFRRTADGGTIEFPQWWLSSFPADAYLIRVFGYAPRPLPVTVAGEDTMVSLSGEEEYAVRAYARQQGFDLLTHDRALFAQWQGQTNNSDVSPTQMMQMAGAAKQEWDRQRGLIRVVRRYW